MTDIEIARNTELKKITEIAKDLDITEDEIEMYGKYKAKISREVNEKLQNKQDGKLILVTAMNPTPLGEGKTTISIAIADGLKKIGKKSILALREPSLGPVFGIKGGATGGGHAQIAPMEDINLHFTGDIHAITSANNLLSAMIDNHIYHGNELGIEKVVWKRCVDLNDRQLRKINTGLSGESKIVPREDGFDISVASEVMAILCLATDINDLKKRLGNILIGYNKKQEPIYARDIKAEGAMAVLLKDAIKPNLVQTLEHTPAILHGGPFANIAHGCNSIIATKMAMKLADYTVTEAGFGADLGAEKFLDIKCREANLVPNVVVCVATIKALKYHGGVLKEDMQKENMNCLEKGMNNLYRHIDNLRGKFGLNVIVAINKFGTDTEEELNFVQNELAKREIPSSIVESWAKGGEGATDISNQIVEIATYVSQYGPNFVNVIPEDVMLSLVSSAAITIIIGIILFVIFTLLFYMGLCRFAKYNSLSEGADIPEAARDLARIGIGKVIGWMILLFVIIAVITFIEMFISSIPYVGILISAFLISTYNLFIVYRSVGLLYSAI